MGPSIARQSSNTVLHVRHDDRRSRLMLQRSKYLARGV